jgi:hypothetical protein
MDGGMTQPGFFSGDEQRAFGGINSDAPNTFFFDYGGVIAEHASM